jgi:hypothetical protein
MLEGFSRTRGRGRSQHKGHTIRRVLRMERRVRVRPHDAFQQKHETEDRQLKHEGIGRGHTRDPHVSIQAKDQGQHLRYKPSSGRHVMKTSSPAHTIVRK